MTPEPTTDVVVLRQPGGVLVAGRPGTVEVVVSQLMEATGAEPSSTLSTGITELAAIGATVGALVVTHGQYFRLTPRSEAILAQLAPVQSGSDSIWGFVRGSGGRFAGNLDFQGVSLGPERMMALQTAAVSLALRAAIRDVQAAVERVEGKVDDVLGLLRSERLGDVLGTRRVLETLVERVRHDGRISMADWSAIAALGADSAKVLEALRAHIRQRLEAADGGWRAGERVKDAERLFERKGLLIESLALLVVAEHNLGAWHELRIAQVRAHEPDHLPWTVADTQAALAGQYADDQAIVDALRLVADRLTTPLPLDGLAPWERDHFERARTRLDELARWFANQRVLELPPLGDLPYPTVRESFRVASRGIGEIAGRSVEAVRKRITRNEPHVLEELSPPELPHGGRVRDLDGDHVTMLDRAVGTLLGLACGDAVGTTLEFKPPGSFEPITDMVGGGPFGLMAGEWTDDTSMALCLAESILDTGSLDLADQLRRYLLWKDAGYLSSNGRCFDIGMTVRTQLERFRRMGEAIDPRPDDESAANGSLMRLAAVPIRWHADPATAAEQSGQSSRTTHAARRPVDACRLMGAIVSALIAGAAFEDVVAPAFWQWGELHPAIAEIATGTWKGKQPPAIRGTGYCVHALEAALWAVAAAADFHDAVLRAANLGDDADTTAAIAGQLAGARWGASAIPVGWREKLVAGERIVSLARGLFVAGGGDAGSAVWAHDDFVHAWWVQPGRLLAGEYPGHPSPARARQKVDLLVDAGIRTFVDLTTPADRLEPYQPLIAQVASARALDVRHVSFPIPDLGVVDDHQYDDVCASIEDGLRRGAVYVHCWGGVGRTGTVIGCVLADQGLTYDEVIDELTSLRRTSRKARREAPEMSVQHDLIRRRVDRRLS